MGDSTTDIRMPTIIIGIGGTGVKILRKIKKQLIDQFDKIPPIIKLLAFDIKDQPYKVGRGAGERILVNGSEFIQLQGINLKAVHQNPDHPSINSWLHDELDPGLLNEGANQIRVQGRAALHIKIGEISSQLIKAIEDINLVSISYTGSKIEIYIICALCGGTGGGMFIDMPYICRKLEEKYAPNGIFITGILVLPEGVTGMPIPVLVAANAYTALLELDWYMQKKHYICKFPPPLKEINIKNKPYDLCYLVGSKNNDGKSLSGKEEVTEMIATGVVLMAASALNSEYQDSRDDLSTSLNNEYTHTNNHTYATCYSGLGISKWIFSSKELVDICSAKLGLDVLENYLNNNKIETDLERKAKDFLTRIKIFNVEELMSRISLKNFTNFILKPIDFKNVKRGKIARAILNRAQVTKDYLISELIRQMTIYEERIREEFKNSLNEEIIDILNHPDKGVICAQKFIRLLHHDIRSFQVNLENINQNKNFKNMISSIKEKQQEYYQHLMDSDRKPITLKSGFLEALIDNLLFWVDKRRQEYLERYKHSYINVINKDLELQAEQEVIKIARHLITVLISNVEAVDSIITDIRDKLNYSQVLLKKHIYKMEKRYNKNKSKADNRYNLVTIREPAQLNDIDRILSDEKININQEIANLFYYFRNFVKELFINKSLIPDDIKQLILEYGSNQKYKQLFKISISKLIYDRYGGVKANIQREYNELVKYSEPYLEFNTNPSEKWKQKDQLVYSISTNDETAMNALSQTISSSDLDFRHVVTKNINEITILRTVHTISLILLKQLEFYRSSYQEQKYNYKHPLFLSKVWENDLSKIGVFNYFGNEFSGNIDTEKSEFQKSEREKEFSETNERDFLSKLASGVGKTTEDITNAFEEFKRNRRIGASNNESGRK